MRSTYSQRQASLLLLLAVLAGACALAIGPLFGDRVSRLDDLHRVSVTVLALVVQALPYIVVGGIVSAAAGVWMTSSRWRRVLPDSPLGATAMGVALGVVIPTCECASVLVARRLLSQGVPAPAAVGFMIAAPSLNPIVVLATASAFASWKWALYRVLAGLLAVIVVCAAVAVRRPRQPWQLPYQEETHQVLSAGSPWLRLIGMARGDILTATGFLALGGMLAGLFQQITPADLLQHSIQQPVLGVGVAVLGAMVLCLCSYSDAFVAASIPAVPVASLAFLAVGPIVDAKLIILMSRFLGGALTARIGVGGVLGGVVGAVLVGAAL